MKMNRDAQLELQACLDSELSAREARRVAVWLAADAEAGALASELRNTKRALADNEAPRALPETREFFWSKIEREIKWQEAAEPALAASRFGFWWKRLLVPAAGVACLVIMVGVAIWQFGGHSGETVGQCELVAALSDSGAITYRNDTTGVTLVWFSYPAQN